jgi:hypothetical protein
MVTKSNPPSINEQVFDCPHRGAYTTQYWFDVLSDSRKENSTPLIPDNEHRERVKGHKDIANEAIDEHLEWCDKMDDGLLLFEKKKTDYPDHSVENIHFCKCYNCKKISVWIHGNLIFPNEKIGVAPNADLPAEIIRDFEEARGILGESPRGAAAPLRLCIQKLCMHLGEKGKNIDDDIASLVLKGLNPLVQKSLDIVRVIGNEAVHPGVIDLNDQMISHPKHVEAMYEKLPESKRMAIEKRDEQSKTKS